MLYQDHTMTCTSPLLSRALKQTSFLVLGAMTKSKKMWEKTTRRGIRNTHKGCTLDTAKHMLLHSRTTLVRIWRFKKRGLKYP